MDGWMEVSGVVVGVVDLSLSDDGGVGAMCGGRRGTYPSTL